MYQWEFTLKVLPGKWRSFIVASLTKANAIETELVAYINRSPLLLLLSNSTQRKQGPV